LTPIFSGLVEANQPPQDAGGSQRLFKNVAPAAYLCVL